MKFSRAFDIGRALDHGYGALRRHLVPMLVGGAIVVALDGGCNGSSYSSSGGDSTTEVEAMEDFFDADRLQAMFESIPGVAELSSADSATIAMVVALAIVLVIVVGLVLLFIESWIQVGWIRLHHDILVHDKAQVGRLFSGADRAGTAFKHRVLVAFISFGTTMAAGLPGLLLVALGISLGSMAVWMPGAILAFLGALVASLYVRLGLALGLHAVVLDDKGALEAVEQSWELAAGNRAHIFVYQLAMGVLEGLAGFVGLLMLCVGAFVTVPAMRAIGDFGFTEAYLLFTRDPGEHAAWKGASAERA